MTHNSRSDRLLWGATILLFAISIIPNLFRYIPLGHDFVYHCMRLTGIASEFKLGDFFPMIYTTVLGGIGYGSPFYYPDLFLYPFAGLLSLGLPLQWTYKLLLTILVLASFFSMYSCAKTFMERRSAHIAAIAYSFSYYVLFDILARAAIGECLGVIFLPVVYLGYRRIADGQTGQWWILALGMTCIVYSHMLSVILVSIFLVILILFDFRHWTQHFGDFRYFVYAALLCLALSCAFWLPMLEQMIAAAFSVGGDSTLSANFLGKVYSAVRLLAPPAITLFTGTDTQAYPRPGGLAFYAAVLLAVISLAKAQKHRAFKLCGMLLLIFIMAVKQPLNTLLARTPYAVIQFPWRLLMPFTLLVSLLMAEGFRAAKSKRVRALLAVLLVLSGLSSAYFNTPTDMYRYAERKRGELSLAAYTDACLDVKSLPADYPGILRQDIPREPICSDGSLSVTLDRDIKNRMIVTFDSNPGDAYVDLPLVYDVGYTAIDSNGSVLPGSVGT
ncbi:MAG: YfhO family protein, partial [Clostridia bacterium]|nr:YfhO family protein [Clostridia bacterium]